MKKICFILLSLLLIGCNDLSNTPTKKAEDFLKKYQSLDQKVIADLNQVVNDNTELNDSQKKVYLDIMKKHYQNLSYEVKEETVDGDEAVVTIEIAVTDFNKVLDEANEYMNNNKEEFNDENGNYNASKFNDYKLEKLKDAKEKVKYTIELELTKTNGDWVVDNPSQTTYDKINGIYDY